MSNTKSIACHAKIDGFHGERFFTSQDKYPGKERICFGGSDGKFELSQMLAEIFQSHGLTTMALAYVMEEGLPKHFSHVPIDLIRGSNKTIT